MKKTYINPKMKVVETKRHMLLAGSPGLQGTYSGGRVLAPRMGGDDDDFDFDE